MAGVTLTLSLTLSVVTSAAAQTPISTSDAVGTQMTGTSTPDAAATETASTPLATTTQSLCLPYLDGALSTNCLLAGPAQVISTLGSKGITFPPEPLAIAHPSADLANIPFSYAIVSPDEVPEYASVEDAVALNVKETLRAGKIKYVALSQKQVGSDGNVYYQIANEDWISASVIKKVSATFYQGYVIKQVPTVVFGVILQSEMPSYTQPSTTSPTTGKIYNRLDQVYCYDSKVVNNVEWVMIGPNEWIQHSLVARFINNPTPPAGVTNGRWIEVNLYEQVLAVYDNSKMVFATLISTGQAPFYTRPGTFKIYKKIEHEYMTGAFEANRSDFYYLEQVPYILYFDDARALHGAYWNSYFGYPLSHGCVNLSVADAHWLYNWANEGDVVYVWDPSGKTPFESEVYSQGAF
jgi:lipoprotein-anchoring transpeptidase ErfK/SrfK